jgi:hypothetical protein
MKIFEHLNQLTEKQKNQTKTLLNVALGMKKGVKHPA